MLTNNSNVMDSLACFNVWLGCNLCLDCSYDSTKYFDILYLPTGAVYLRTAFCCTEKQKNLVSYFNNAAVGKCNNLISLYFDVLILEALLNHYLKDIFYTQQVSTWLRPHLLVSYNAVEDVIVPTDLEGVKHKQPPTISTLHCGWMLNLLAERLLG